MIRLTEDSNKEKKNPSHNRRGRQATLGGRVIRVEVVDSFLVSGFLESFRIKPRDEDVVEGVWIDDVWILSVFEMPVSRSGWNSTSE